MDMFPTLTATQLKQLAHMSPRELLDKAEDKRSKAEEHQGLSKLCLIEAAVYEAVAADTTSAAMSPAGSLSRAPARAQRGPKAGRRGGQAKRGSPRLPDDLARERLPRFGLQRGEDPTGQKEMILGVLWITKSKYPLWSPRDLEDEVSRVGIGTFKRNMATTFLRRMAVSDPPLVLKLGKGRGTRYEVAPGIEPIGPTEVVRA